MRNKKVKKNDLEANALTVFVRYIATTHEIYYATKAIIYGYYYCYTAFTLRGVALLHTPQLQNDRFGEHVR
jgi:hypothetical protein